MAANETPAGDPVPKLDSSNVIEFCNNSNSILMLPGVLRSDIHNVDDIIYAQFGIPNNYFIGIPADLREIRIDIKMDFYRLVDYLLDMCREPWEIPDQVWLTYFKLLHHSSESDFKDMGLKIMEILPKLMSSRDVRLICNAIKIIQTITSRSEDLFANYFKEKFDNHHIFIYLECKLCNFPEAFDERDRRIASWISSQSKLVTKHLMTQHGYNTHDSFDYLQILTGRYIWEESDISEIFDVLVTTKRENFHTFVRYFIEEVLRDVIDHHTVLTRYKFHSKKIKPIISSLVFGYVEPTKPDRNWLETDYNAIANCIGFNMDSCKSGYFNEAKEMNCIRNYYDEGNGDYTIMKFLVFDDFVRRVQILNIFDREYFYHKAILNAKEGELRFEEEYGDLVLEYRKLFYKALIEKDPSKRTQFQWSFRFLMKLCPRVFLPATRYNEDGELMGSLLAWLNNEEVERAALEEVSFCLFTNNHRFECIRDIE